MNLDKLVKVLKKYPQCYIYYSDNGGWELYTSKKDFEQLQEMDYDTELLLHTEYDAYLKKIQLYSESDYDNMNGYVPLLVEALATISGHEVGST